MYTSMHLCDFFMANVWMTFSSISVLLWYVHHILTLRRNRIKKYFSWKETRQPTSHSTHWLCDVASVVLCDTSVCVCVCLCLKNGVHKEKTGYTKNKRRAYTICCSETWRNHKLSGQVSQQIIKKIQKITVLNFVSYSIVKLYYINYP